MGSASNWLGFSLSPQEHHAQTQDRLNLAVGDTSAAAFNFSNLIPDGSFTVLEDWNSKSLNFKGTSSELSMVVGSRRNEEESSEPKLEDFLGGNFSGHSQKLPPGCRSMTWTFDNTADCVFSNYSLQIPALPSAAKEVSVSENNAGNDCSIGLSMIKTWLRTQPAAPPLPGGGGSASAFAANSQSLSLSINTASKLCPSLRAGESSSSAEEKNSKAGNGGDGQDTSVEAGPRRIIDSLGHRTSIYRGVTRHRWTGRYEAHLWDNSCRREGQTRKGRQVYLGGYDKEEKAAIAYDLAALKYWGTMTTTNFPISNYRRELDEMRHMTRQEYVASLRRKSSGFSRGASIYRGVTRHHQQGRWQARIGRVAGNKDLYLGTFSTQEEAAEAYDIAAIKFRGLNAVTNFDMNRYDVKSIMESNTLPIGAAGKRPNDEPAINPRTSDVHEGATSLTAGINGSNYLSWSGFPFNPPAINYPYIQQHEQDTLRILRDLHHYQTGGAANRFLPPPLPAAVSLDSCAAIYGSGGEGFLGDHGVDFPSSRPLSCRNIYSISEQSPGGEANGSSLPVCYGGPIFSVWNDN